MHIEHFPKMLALPVERLIGNVSVVSGRMSLSPSSSVNSSIDDCDGSSNNSNANMKCSCTKKISNPTTSIPTPSPSPEGENNNGNGNENNSVSSIVMSPPIIGKIKVETEEKRGEEVNQITKEEKEKPSALDHQQEDEDDEEGEIDIDGDDDNDNGIDNGNEEGNNEKKSPNNSLPNNHNHPSTINGNHHHKSLFPSFVSNTSIGNKPNVGLNLTTNKPTIANTSSPPSLKFSIEDILRPDFGLSRFQLLAQQQLSLKRGLPRSSSSLPSPGISPKKASTSSVSSSEGHRPYRPVGNFQYHSEDSNGSDVSKSSRITNREPEVVDDTKVNPKVPDGPLLWPAWVYCTRYSDRPSSGPRSRRIRKEPREVPEEKRPRTAFTAEQLSRLKQEFDENRYLTEKRRQDLARDLKLHENQIKIWFQNKRAKLKKSNGTKNVLARQLMAQGLYNHSTVPVDEDDEMMMEMM